MPRHRFKPLLGLYRTQLIGAGIFSGVINVLALSGSLYMLQVYDRVLPSKSVPTLVGFTVLLIILYVAFGALDYCRARLLSRIGLDLDDRIRENAMTAALKASVRAGPSMDPMQPVRDLDNVRTFLSGPGPTALFDLPWMPIYLALIWILHPILGALATAGGVMLITLTMLTEWRTRSPISRSQESQTEAGAFGYSALRNAESIAAMGMSGALISRWQGLRDRQLADQVAVSDVAGGIGTVSKTARLLLQSGVLGLGAYLAIGGQVSPGAIIAASIIVSRALAPIEIAIANWKGFVAARQSYARLKTALEIDAPETRGVTLPKARRALDVTALTLRAPESERDIIRNVAFRLEAGDALGVIGPSAAGKSTLVKALVGIWLPHDPASAIRLDGSEFGQWGSAALGANIGYLPQTSELLQGTIAENIARFDANATTEQVIEAARLAGVHDMIVKLPGGYDMPVASGRSNLSVGQVQRLALARALYGNPFLVVLDEPNSNLDAEGDAALTHAIQSVRNRGGIVIVVAHRPSALNAVNKILVLVDGAVQDFGSREAILATLMKRGPQPATGSQENKIAHGADASGSAGDRSLQSVNR